MTEAYGVKLHLSHRSVTGYEGVRVHIPCAATARSNTMLLRQALWLAAERHVERRPQPTSGNRPYMRSTRRSPLSSLSSLPLSASA